MKYKRKFKNKKKQTGGPIDPPIGRFGYLGDAIFNRSADNQYYGDRVVAPINEGSRELFGPYVGNAVSGVNELVRTPLNFADAIYRGVNYDPNAQPQQSPQQSQGASYGAPASIARIPDYINDINNMFDGASPTQNQPQPQTRQTTPSNTPTSSPSQATTRDTAVEPESNSVVSNAEIGGASLPDTGIAYEPTGLESVGNTTIPSTTESVSNDLGEAGGGGNQGGGFGLGSALQYIPEAINFATGVFGRDTTPEATRMSDRSVQTASRMPTDINVNPQLVQARANYRAILEDPSATANQKLAAQAQLNNQMNSIYADKINRETQLQANKTQLEASMRARVDATNARYTEQRRQDQMASDANFGLSGNFARQALTSASTKALQNRAMENERRQRTAELEMFLKSLDPAARKRILENYDNGE